MRTLLIASVCFTSLLGALLGYDIGIISGAIVFITKDLSLSTWQAEVVVGSLNLVSAFGALLVGTFADRFGRKAAIYLANALFVGGTLTVVLSYGFSGLLVGRILMGFGAAHPRSRSSQHSPPLSPSPSPPPYPASVPVPRRRLWLRGRTTVHRGALAARATRHVHLALRGRHRDGHPPRVPCRLRVPGHAPPHWLARDGRLRRRAACGVAPPPRGPARVASLPLGGGQATASA